MKILHIVNSFSEGGVESLLLELLPRIVDRGYQIDLLVLNASELALKESVEKHNVKVIAGRYHNVYDPRNIWLIKSYLKHYDAVHIHLFPTQIYAVLARMLCNVKIPFFTTEHGSYNNRRSHKWFKYIDKWFYKKYNQVIAVSPTVKRSLFEWTKVESDVICNGINLERFQKIQENPISRKMLSLTPDDKVIIMVARFGYPKCHDTVIRSLPHLAEQYKVIFVGSGERLDECAKLAVKFGVDQRITFVGNSTSPEHYIEISDIAVLCTENEGFGISVLEYAALGKPVIVSDIESMRDNFESYVEMVELYNEKALAQAISKIAEDENLYREMSEKSLACAMKYEISHTVIQYCELYNKFKQHGAI